MSSDLDALRDSIVLGDLTPQQVQRARLKVCEAAADVADARLLMEALGLLPSESEVTRRWERR